MKTYCKQLDKDFGEDEDFPLYSEVGDLAYVNGIKYERSEMGWEQII